LAELEGFGVPTEGAVGGGQGDHARKRVGVVGAEVFAINRSGPLGLIGCDPGFAQVRERH
jgi:hypothetical protein